METFINYNPGALDRQRLYSQGNRVLCSDCWWTGPSEDYDYCPDCKNDRLEWIVEKEDDYDYIQLALLLNHLTQNSTTL
ncbi:MAG: hypothetical protein HOD92_24040 [Deltaproteobacteria bacterium]|jgi:hypothetical protein|nr:hypothetical protein [Deltaproteobacteria bacterium]